jgi:hypothetical protein
MKKLTLVLVGAMLIVIGSVAVKYSLTLRSLRRTS